VNNLERKGFASGNIVFGEGSWSFQGVTRDTYGFAMKATWVDIDGKGHNIFKTPVTDSGMKNSARGRLAVVRDAAGELALIENANPADEIDSLLQPVWQDGKFVKRETFPTIRERARSTQVQVLWP
jgi:nicotinamide phosphoribosyltransferase